MNAFRQPGGALAGTVQPSTAEEEADGAPSRSWRRYSRWGRMAAVALIAAAAWVIGREVARRIEDGDIARSSRRQPPLPGLPAATRTVLNNNTIMKMGFVGNLDGKAIAYTAEADGLVAGGQFRTDLPLEALAAILRVSPDAIAHPRFPHQVDPNAELFRAQAGTLTANAKARSRDTREWQRQHGKTQDGVAAEWTVRDFSFTLTRLRHPDDEEKAVLSAILRAAGETMPQPGDTMRAVGVFRGTLDVGKIAVAPGMLPLAAQPDPAAIMGTERSAPLP
jgi:hypothetical protein